MSATTSCETLCLFFFCMLGQFNVLGHVHAYYTRECNWNILYFLSWVCL